MRTPARMVLLLLVVVGCAVPGQLYEVAPAIEGILSDSAGGSPDGWVTLSVRHRENPRLYGRAQARVDERGRFSFPAIEFLVAGQEYDKRYELYLHHTDAAGRSAIWKVAYSRLQLGEMVYLSCRVDRPPVEGLPCKEVGDMSRHAWIVEEGEHAYARYCVGCHGPHARGGGPDGAGLASRPPDLTRIAERHSGAFPDDAIAAWIDGRLGRAHGGEEMPIWGNVLAEESPPGGFGEALARRRVDAIVAYLSTLQVREGD